MNKTDRVFKIVGQIPRGKVLTYGRIAKSAGVKNARPLGNWLHSHDQPIAVVPCHRVVNVQGKLAKNFGAKGKIKTQAARLRREGVEVNNYRVDLKKYLWETKP